MARVGANRMTYADLQRMPDDGRQYELYDGEVRVVPSPTNRHQVVLLNLIALLLEYERQHGGRLLFAPSDVVFSKHNVIQPDILYFTEARRHLVQLDSPTRAAPDLTVEVLSPGTSANDRGRKQAMCARFGVGEYWLVDPFEETIEIFVLDGDVAHGPPEDPVKNTANHRDRRDGREERLEGGHYVRVSTAGAHDVAISPTIAGLGVAAGRVFDLS